MAPSSNYIIFVRGWQQKADKIKLCENDFATYFDKFVTLFIIYNRLYREATFTLWQKYPDIEPNSHQSFPESPAAKRYVAEFLDGPTLLMALQAHSRTRQAIEEMERILEDGQFPIILTGPKAEANRAEDESLLDRFRSDDDWKRAKAILEFVHAVRCNTVHGGPNFDRVQIEVLKPCITVLSKLNDLLSKKLFCDELLR